MRTTAIVFLMLIAAAASLAQGPCDTAINRPCDGMFIRYDVGTGGWNAPATVCGEPWVSCNATIFEVTVTAPTTVTAHVAFPGGSGTPTLTLLENCEGTMCVDQVDVSGDMSWSHCLPAGTYYLVYNEPTCLFYQFDFMVTCQPCDDPVATGPETWGALKALYR